jgi:hypothetical protein
LIRPGRRARASPRRTLRGFAQPFGPSFVVTVGGPRIGGRGSRSTRTAFDRRRPALSGKRGARSLPRPGRGKEPRRAGRPFPGAQFSQSGNSPISCLAEPTARRQDRERPQSAGSACGRGGLRRPRHGVGPPAVRRGTATQDPQRRPVTGTWRGQRKPLGLRATPCSPLARQTAAPCESGSHHDAADSAQRFSSFRNGRRRQSSAGLDHQQELGEGARMPATPMRKTVGCLSFRRR